MLVCSAVVQVVVVYSISLVLDHVFKLELIDVIGLSICAFP